MTPTYSQLTFSALCSIAVFMGTLAWGITNHVQELVQVSELMPHLPSFSMDDVDSLIAQHHDRIHHQALMLAVLFAASGGLVLWWIYHSHQRLQALSPAPAFSPLSAVLWYFVPVMNLIKPFEAMQELVQHSNREGTVLKPSFLVGLWWLLWIFAQICYGYTLAQNPLVDDLEDILTLDSMFIGCNIVLLLLSAALVALISQIYRMQQQSPLLQAQH